MIRSIFKDVNVNYDKYLKEYKMVGRWKLSVVGALVVRCTLFLSLSRLSTKAKRPSTTGNIHKQSWILYIYLSSS